MNERINELIEECTSVNDDLVYDGSESYMQTTEYFDKEKFAALVAAAARADERNFIATKWENLYGYDKQGVAEFIRKRANTQEETT